MHTERIDIAERLWNPATTEEVHQSMDAFLIIDMIVPEHILIWDIGLWVAFVASVHAGELDRVADEEDWQIVEHKVLVALFRVHLHGEATDIAEGIAGTFLASDGRDTAENIGFLADLIEESSVRKV